MFKILLEQASEIELLSIVSLLLFFVSFSFILIRTIRMDAGTAEQISRLPLDDNNMADEIEEGNDE